MQTLPFMQNDFDLSGRNLGMGPKGASVLNGEESFATAVLKAIGQDNNDFMPGESEAKAVPNADFGGEGEVNDQVPQRHGLRKAVDFVNIGIQLLDADIDNTEVSKYIREGEFPGDLYFALTAAAKDLDQIKSLRQQLSKVLQITEQASAVDTAASVTSPAITPVQDSEVSDSLSEEIQTLQQLIASMLDQDQAVNDMGGNENLQSLRQQLSKVLQITEQASAVDTAASVTSPAITPVQDSEVSDSLSEEIQTLQQLIASMLDQDQAVNDMGGNENLQSLRQQLSKVLQITEQASAVDTAASVTSPAITPVQDSEVSDSLSEEIQTLQQLIASMLDQDQAVNDMGGNENLQSLRQQLSKVLQITEQASAVDTAASVTSPAITPVQDSEVSDSLSEEIQTLQQLIASMLDQDQAVNDMGGNENLQSLRQQLSKVLQITEQASAVDTAASVTSPAITPVQDSEVSDSLSEEIQTLQQLIASMLDQDQAVNDMGGNENLQSLRQQLSKVLQITEQASAVDTAASVTSPAITPVQDSEVSDSLSEEIQTLQQLIASMLDQDQAVNDMGGNENLQSLRRQLSKVLQITEQASAVDTAASVTSPAITPVQDSEVSDSLSEEIQTLQQLIASMLDQDQAVNDMGGNENLQSLRRQLSKVLQITEQASAVDTAASVTSPAITPVQDSEVSDSLSEEIQTLQQLIASMLDQDQAVNDMGGNENLQSLRQQLSKVLQITEQTSVVDIAASVTSPAITPVQDSEVSDSLSEEIQTLQQLIASMLDQDQAVNDMGGNENLQSLRRQLSKVLQITEQASAVDTAASVTSPAITPVQDSEVSDSLSEEIQTLQQLIASMLDQDQAVKDVGGNEKTEHHALLTTQGIDKLRNLLASQLFQIEEGFKNLYEPEGIKLHGDIGIEKLQSLNALLSQSADTIKTGISNVENNRVITQLSAEISELLTLVQEDLGYGKKQSSYLYATGSRFDPEVVAGFIDKSPSKPSAWDVTAIEDPRFAGLLNKSTEFSSLREKQGEKHSSLLSGPFNDVTGKQERTLDGMEQTTADAPGLTGKPSKMIPANTFEDAHRLNNELSGIREFALDFTEGQPGTHKENVNFGSQNIKPEGTANASPSTIILKNGDALPTSKVVDQTIEHLSLHARGDSSVVTVKLHPEELGELSIRMMMEGDQLKLQIQAQNQQVREILEQNFPKLRTAMENQGLTVEDFQVNLGDSRADDHARQQSDDSALRKMFGGDLDFAGADNDEFEAGVQKRSDYSTGRLSVLV